MQEKKLYVLVDEMAYGTKWDMWAAQMITHCPSGRKMHRKREINTSFMRRTLHTLNQSNFFRLNVFQVRSFLFDAKKKANGNV